MTTKPDQTLHQLATWLCRPGRQITISHRQAGDPIEIRLQDAIDSRGAESDLHGRLLRLAMAPGHLLAGHLADALEKINTINNSKGGT